MNDIFLTIITPTYNRAELLPRVFESLRKQTDYDFEWVIVNDGSTDNTEDVLKTFSSDLFSICIVNKVNGGKHTALNESHHYINGKYVLILDSDDKLVSNAVELIKKEWTKFAMYKNVYGLIFMRGQGAMDKVTPFCKVKNELVPVNYYKTKRIVISSSDCCEVIRSDLFIQYPFPVFENENFIGESALWDRIAKNRECVYVNEVIYLCEYLNDGLTRSGRILRLKNLAGGMYTARLKTENNHTLPCRIKNMILYICYGLFRNLNFYYIITGTDNLLLLCLCLPFGWILYKYWKRKYNNFI